MRALLVLAAAVITSLTGWQAGGRRPRCRPLAGGLQLLRTSIGGALRRTRMANVVRVILRSIGRVVADFTSQPHPPGPSTGIRSPSVTAAVEQRYSQEGDDFFRCHRHHKDVSMAAA
jgi:hypothetical protein